LAFSPIGVFPAALNHGLVFADRFNIDRWIVGFSSNALYLRRRASVLKTPALSVAFVCVLQSIDGGIDYRARRNVRAATRPRIAP
jgi:hypothetical protein